MNLITTDPAITAAVAAITPTTNYERIGQLAAAIARGEPTSTITLIDQTAARTAAATGAPHGVRLFVVTTAPTAETYAYAKLAGAEGVITLPAAAQLAELAEGAAL